MLRKLLSYIISVLLVFSFFQSEAQVKRPDFVKNYIEKFGGEQREHFAFSQFFGWGEGVYANNEKFLWFAFSNSDGYLQFRVSSPIPVDYAADFCSVKDKHNRNWKTSENWIGITNDWIDTMPNGGRQVLNWGLKEMLKTRVFKSLKVREYLK
ncbi:MAG: hypothetical protein NT120_00560 [Candidatus Aenigmarchaeota archaeon]|nr:hypothetical protein [Candidatus Aenigmarchaeota archaeon]